MYQFRVPRRKTVFVLAKDWAFSLKRSYLNSEIIALQYFGGKVDSSMWREPDKKWLITVPYGTYLRIDKIMNSMSYKAGVTLTVTKDNSGPLRLVKFVVPLDEFERLEYYPVAEALAKGIIQPSMGKSRMIKDYAEKHGIECKDLGFDITNRGDMFGLPIIGDSGEN